MKLYKIHCSITQENLHSSSMEKVGTFAFRKFYLVEEVQKGSFSYKIVQMNLFQRCIAAIFYLGAKNYLQKKFSKVLPSIESIQIKRKGVSFAEDTQVPVDVVPKSVVIQKSSLLQSFEKILFEKQKELLDLVQPWSIDTTIMKQVELFSNIEKKNNLSEQECIKRKVKKWFSIIHSCRNAVIASSSDKDKKMVALNAYKKSFADQCIALAHGNVEATFLARLVFQEDRQYL